MSAAPSSFSSRPAAFMGLVIRAGLGLLFIKAGLAKLIEFDWWRDLVARMDIIGDAWSGPLAGMLPGIEFLCGLALLGGLFTRSAAYLAALLHVLFGTIMIVLVLRDAPMHCGCFGPGSEYPVDFMHVMFNVAQGAAALLLVVLPRHLLSLDRLRARR